MSRPLALEDFPHEVCVTDVASKDSQVLVRALQMVQVGLLYSDIIVVIYFVHYDHSISS